MSFTTPTRVRSAPAIPLAPMVDILFLLLIFFVTTSVFREYDQQIDVTPPATESGYMPHSPTQIVITVTRENQVYIGDKNYDREDLAGTLYELASQFPNEKVFIRGDSGSLWGTVCEVMDVAYQAGFADVAASPRRPTELVQ